LLKFAIDSPVNYVPLDGNGQAVTSLVSNTGLINAAGGTVQVSAAATAGLLSNLVDMPGQINAPSYAATPGAVTIDAGAGNAARLGGTIDVAGLEAGQVGGNAVVTGG